MAVALSGHKPAASELTVLDQAAAAWPSYIPVWTSTGTAPALGNGTISGSYIQVGKTVTARGKLTFGSTSTLGSGNFRISTPVSASANSIDQSVGALWIVRIGVGANIGTCILEGTTTLRPSTSSGDISPTSPYAWASGDQIHWQFQYEAA